MADDDKFRQDMQIKKGGSTTVDPDVEDTPSTPEQASQDKGKEV